MSGKQSKRFRALAYAEAQKRDLWKDCKQYIFATLWQKLLARLSKRYRSRLLNKTGYLYRRNLKAWAKGIANYFRSGQAEIDAADRRSFEHTRRKLQAPRKE